MTPQNFAARAGRWSANHWKTAVFGWLAAAIVAVVLGQVVGSRELADADTASGETAQAEKIFEHASFANVAGETVLVQSATREATDPLLRQSIGRAIDRRLR